MSRLDLYDVLEPGRVPGIGDVAGDMSRAAAAGRDGYLEHTSLAAPGAPGTALRLV